MSRLAGKYICKNEKHNMGSGSTVSRNFLLRQIALLVMGVLIIFLLPGCSSDTPDNAERIGLPLNSATPVDGTWQLKSCLQNEEAEVLAQTGDPMIGEKIGFSKDVLAFAGDYYRNISYKIKRVNVEEYFLHKNAGIPEKLANEDSEIFVVTVYSEEQFLFELIKSSRGELIAALDDQLYCMEKVSEEFIDLNSVEESTVVQNGNHDTNGLNRILQSGLLLGIRTPETTVDGLGDYSYKTYWISSIDRSLRPILYTSDIYLPRMDGFWKLRVDKTLGTAGLEDSLVASKVSNKALNKISKDRLEQGFTLFENTSKRVETSNRKAIVYVGNDYVCIENTALEKIEDIADSSIVKTLRILPVDNLAYIDGIKISDLAGDNGRMAMESAISDLLKVSGNKDFVSVNEENQEKNFALYRKTGHWFFKGRINLNQQEQLPYMDFSLNLIPPANMVAYDVLQVPWKDVKDKLPQAIDIYTSPNKDLAVVLTRSEILLYTINNRKLSNEPLAKIPMKEGSSAVMAEWGMGDYVNSWERSFIRNNETASLELH